MKDNFWKKLLITIVGVLIQGFGLSFLLRVNFGVDPCSAMTAGVITHVNLSFGTASLICNIIMIISVLIWGRKYIGPGTIANMVFIGYISDFCQWVQNMIIPESVWEIFWVRVMVLIPALIVFLVGAAMYMSAGMGASPYDAIPFIIFDAVSKKKQIKFRYLRMCWDGAFMLGAVLLLGRVGDKVGVVTLAVVLFLGGLVEIMQRFLKRAFKI